MIKLISALVKRILGERTHGEHTLGERTLGERTLYKFGQLLDIMDILSLG